MAARRQLDRRRAARGARCASPARAARCSTPRARGSSRRSSRAGSRAAAERAGARIFEGTEVTAIEPRAARTAAATCAPAGSFARPRATRPDRACADQLVDDRHRAAARRRLEEIGWEGGETMMAAAHAYCYLQRTADGRIAIGGRGTPYRWHGANARMERPDDRTIASLRARLDALFPAAADVPTAAAWTGVLGVARDWTPAVRADPATGLAFAGGYVGEGVAATNLAGRTLRDLILGRDTELTRLDWVGHDSPRWEPDPLRWIGIRTVYRSLPRRRPRRGPQRPARPGWPLSLTVSPGADAARLWPRADVAQLVERWLPEPKVAGSRPVVRFNKAPQTARFCFRPPGGCIDRRPLRQTPGECGGPEPRGST